MRRLCAILSACLLSTPAYAMEFGIPIRCTYGTDCFIQNYVDAEKGPSRKDYRCGHLSYNGHDGTDIRLPDFTWLEKNVEVLAAADGIVGGIRDGMPDTSIRDSGQDAIKDKECGNGVRIEHGEGWTTQYCHMKRGSIAVKERQQVKKGDILGFVGLSGETEFPHLHFAVRHANVKLDPFSGQELEHGCGVAAQSLWDGAAQATLTYRPTSILSTGIADKAMTEKDINGARHGEFSSTILPADAPALIVWLDVMGIQAGSDIVVDITGPEDFSRRLTKRTDKDQAGYFSFTGLKRQQQEWTSGPYSATITLTQPQGEPLIRTVDFTVR